MDDEKEKDFQEEDMQDRCDISNVGRVIFNTLCAHCPWRDVIHSLESRIAKLEKQLSKRKKRK